MRLPEKMASNPFIMISFNVMIATCRVRSYIISWRYGFWMLVLLSKTGIMIYIFYPIGLNFFFFEIKIYCIYIFWEYFSVGYRNEKEHTKAALYTRMANFARWNRNCAIVILYHSTDEVLSLWEHAHYAVTCAKQEVKKHYFATQIAYWANKPVCNAIIH